MTEHVFGDISDEFDFDEETMDYVDAPLSGWLRSKRDGAWFAYDCQPVIANMLWHWTLIPAAEKASDVAGVLAAAATSGGAWVSITEDRRSGRTSTCRLVRIESGAAPVLFSVRARRS